MSACSVLARGALVCSLVARSVSRRWASPRNCATRFVSRFTPTRYKSTPAHELSPLDGTSACPQRALLEFRPLRRRCFWPLRRGLFPTLGESSRSARNRLVQMCLCLSVLPFG